jgi:hypothetical protein
VDRRHLDIRCRRRLGPTETVITSSNPTGIVQNYTSVMTFLTPEVCGTVEPGVSNGTRVGD